MGPFDHVPPYLPVQGLSFLAKKIVGDRQLSDLGMQVTNRIFGDLGDSGGLTTTLKDPCSAFFP
jgi:hypothetical protein